MLREKTQRRLFRLLFVLGCVAPTLAIGGWAIARRTPIYRTAVLGHVSQRAGVALTADRLTSPTPGVVVVEALRVATPETDRTIAECDHVRLTRSEDGWLVTLGHVEIAALGSRDGSPIPWDRLPIVSASADQITLRGPASQPIGAWRRVHCRVTRDGDHTTIAARSLTDDGDVAAEIEATRLGADGLTRVLVDTGEAGVACRFVSDESAFAPLLDAAAFRGRVEATIDGPRPRIFAQGSITIGPLDTASTRGMAEWRSATLRIDELRWEATYLAALDASLECQRGRLGKAFLWGLNQQLGCGATPALEAAYQSPASDGGVPFDELATRLRFDAAGLDLRGLIADGVLASRQGDALLHEPVNRPLPLTTLVRALWPLSTPEVPGTAEAQEVARRLPLPSNPLSR